MDYVMINKYIERMADHAANIADWVSFVVNQLKLKFTDRYKRKATEGLKDKGITPSVNGSHLPGGFFRLYRRFQMPFPAEIFCFNF